MGLAVVGLLMSLTGGFLAFEYMRTPPVLLEKPAPGERGALHRRGADLIDDLLAQLPLSPYAQSHPAPERPPQPRQGLWLEIPALDVALPVQNGDGSDRIPYWVALRYPGTADPGTAGNSYLYAHGIRGMFGALLLAHQGDDVLVHDYTASTVKTFHVSRVVGKVRYNDLTYIRLHSTQPTLTLQTCVDDNVRGDRFIVQAT
jgi:LPXTG-site transpeptidase (sortase) family protein